MRPRVLIPVLNPRCSTGEIDQRSLRAYAARAAATWADAFLLSGSTTRGDLLDAAQRQQVMDVWLEYAQPSRLIACCWEARDIYTAADRGVPAMVVLRDLRSYPSGIDFLATLPPGAYIYSHPRYTLTTFDGELARAAAEAGVLPVGGKISKIGLGEISAVRAAAGPGFALWDGSSRHVAASVSAGATGVVTTALSPFAEPFPAWDFTALQTCLDKLQADLDALPTPIQRTALLLSRAFPGVT